MQAGGIVLGPKPVGPTGNVASRDGVAFQRLAKDVWGDCNAASHRFGKGRAFCSSSGNSILKQLGVAPDFQQVGGQTELDFVRRRDGDTDIYFIRNGSAEAVSTMAVFRVTGRQPAIWDPVTGAVTAEMLYDQDTTAGVTRMPLRLPAYGSLFVIFTQRSGLHATSVTRDGIAVIPKSATKPAEPVVMRCGTDFCLNAIDPGEYLITLSNGQRLEGYVEASPSVQPLDGAWTLKFQAGRGAPENPISISELTDWSQSKDPRIRYFSGTATYDKQFEYKGVKPGAVVLLQLTHLYHICTVRVNGNDAGTIWAMPYQLDISRFLRPGINRIELSVTNLWPNRIIGDLQPRALRFTHTNIRDYSKDSPLLPSGLVGPVKLMLVRNIRLQLNHKLASDGSVYDMRTIDQEGRPLSTLSAS
ncbi:MAG TPA: glycosyl hydrolase [Bryobacteraceae bacterium]|nr:glycosyl hydrolase [Bryobacteraceae bacterium]